MQGIGSQLHSMACHCSKLDLETWPQQISKHLGLPEDAAQKTDDTHLREQAVTTIDDLQW